MENSHHLDKLEYKAIFLPVLISLIATTIVSLSNFHWTVYIPVIAATLFSCVFEINKQYMIRIEKEDSGNLNLTYYNYLDKIVNESVDNKQLSEHKISRNKKLVTLRFQDNRELKLHCVDGITEQAR